MLIIAILVSHRYTSLKRSEKALVGFVWNSAKPVFLLVLALHSRSVTLRPPETLPETNKMPSHYIEDSLGPPPTRNIPFIEMSSTRTSTAQVASPAFSDVPFSPSEQSSAPISQRLSHHSRTDSASLSSSSSGTSNSDDEVMSSPPTPAPLEDPSLEPFDDGKRMMVEQPRVQALRPRPRHHVRSYSHDAVSGLSRPVASTSKLSAVKIDESNSLPYTPDSPPRSLAKGEQIQISNPIVTESSPRTAHRMSLFTIGGQDATDWPEGEANEQADSIDSESVTSDASEDIGTEITSGEPSEPWRPPVSMPPSTSFAFAGVVSSPVTNKSSGHGVRSRSSPGGTPHLQIGTDRPSRGNSPLPTPMLRKKSGEVVRSSLKYSHYEATAPPPTASTTPHARSVRAKSAPATPTGPKAVHFDKQLEHVKLFLAQQRPAAVSRNGSPGETTEEESEAFPFPAMTPISERVDLHLPNFPASNDRNGRDVYVQSLILHHDTKTLRGKIFVANLSFHKRVAVRFTLDDWQTVSETSAEYEQSVDNGNADIWSFSIKLQDILARIEEKKMFLVVRYNVNNGEIWDNNNGRNYLIQFRKTEAPKQNPLESAGAKRQGKLWAVTNAGQASERMADLRRELDRLVSDEDDHKTPAIIQGNGTFSNRYDIGASLRRKSPRAASTSDVTSLSFHRQSGQIVPGTDLPRPSFTPTPILPVNPSHTEKDGVVSRDYGRPAPAVTKPSFAEPFQPPYFSPSSHPGDQPEFTRDRFNSFPPSRSPQGDAMTPRMADFSTSASTTSFFSYPSTSSISSMSTNEGSETCSPGSSSPQHTFRSSKGRPRSPPPRLPSPDFTLGDSSNNSSYSSPASPLNSIAEADIMKVQLPVLGGMAGSGEEPQTYTGFLERVSLLNSVQNEYHTDFSACSIASSSQSCTRLQH